MSGGDAEFAGLVSAALDGTATPEQRRRLAAVLAADAARRADYVRQARVDTLLGFLGGAAPAQTPPAAGPVRASAGRTGGRGWLAAAAVVALGAGFLLAQPRGTPALIEEAAGTNRTDFVAGRGLRLRHVELAAGRLRLRLESGVRLDVAGPAKLEVLDAMRVRVTHGRVTADVGEQGKGFAIDTAQAKIVDLGTRFGVAVGGDGHTDVVVFQGEVELFDRAARPAAAPLARLTEGQAVRVDDHRQVSRIVSVTAEAGTGGWSTGAAGPGAVIAAVRDNLRDPADRFFYRIVPGGLREDAPAFVSKRHEWNGLDAAGLPDELRGADLVQTFAGDRYAADLEIAVTVARAATLYVLADSSTPPPAWLEREFADTGLRIGLENAPLLSSGRAVGVGPGAGNMAPFAVWRREVAAGGTVTLGPPRENPDLELQWMYGIAARAR
jgi:ferric-dicitrate binding protein FerR (iron transport regulator)